MTFKMIFFVLFAGVAVLSSLFMLTRRTALGGAISLIVCFLAFSGLYVMLDAPFVAVMQVIVYAGAIMMLIVFVIMTVDSDSELLQKERISIIGGAIAVIIVGVGLAGYQFSLYLTPLQGSAAKVIGTVEGVGKLLFTRHVFNFEMISLLLTVALVGALILAKQPKKLQEK